LVDRRIRDALSGIVVVATRAIAVIAIIVVMVLLLLIIARKVVLEGWFSLGIPVGLQLNPASAHHSGTRRKVLSPAIRVGDSGGVAIVLEMNQAGTPGPIRFGVVHVYDWLVPIRRIGIVYVNNGFALNRGIFFGFVVRVGCSLRRLSGAQLAATGVSAPRLLLNQLCNNLDL